MKLLHGLIITALLVGANIISADDWSLDGRGFAIAGYDTVAYFTQQKAVKGTNEYQASWQGVQWLFNSKEHRDLFLASPEAYAPQFGGFCANGLSDGHKVTADPENWRIIDNKLYLFFSKWGRLQWAINVPEQIQLATDYWNEWHQNNQ